MNDQPRRLKKIKGVSLFEVTIKGLRYWRVVSPKPGKGRLSRTFRDKIEARNYYEQQMQLTRNLGRAGGGFSPRQRLDALGALEALKIFPDVTLTRAVEFYTQHHTALDQSVTVTEAISKLLEAKQIDGLSKRYIEDLRHRLNQFSEDFGDRAIAEIGSPEIGDWLRALRLSASTRNTFHMRLSVLFAFAIERRWALSNPLTKSMRAKEIHSEPGIISPEAFAALLSNSQALTRPYWVLGGFCGIRRAEIERLDWRDIHWEGREVEINPAKAKTASRRLVELGDAALSWLAPYRGSTGPVCPRGLDLHRRLVTDRQSAAVSSWPSNALRHSFASYHLAAFADAAKTSLQMGHVSATLLFNHYRQRVRSDVAKQWWAIYPDQGSNVVKIPA
jgi:integrase